MTSVIFESDLPDEFPGRQEDGEESQPDDWFWCVHCGRGYQVKNARHPERWVWLCAYPDCDADCLLDAWPWNGRGGVDVPEAGKEYW